MYINYPFCD